MCTISHNLDRILSSELVITDDLSVDSSHTLLIMLCFSTSSTLTFITLSVFPSSHVASRLPGAFFAIASSKTKISIICTSIYPFLPSSTKSKQPIATPATSEDAQSSPSIASIVSIPSIASVAPKKAKTDPYSGGPISSNPMEDGPARNPGEPSSPDSPAPAVPEALSTAEFFVTPSTTNSASRKGP